MPGPVQGLSIRRSTTACVRWLRTRRGPKATAQFRTASQCEKAERRPGYPRPNLLVKLVPGRRPTAIVHRCPGFRHAASGPYPLPEGHCTVIRQPPPLGTGAVTATIATAVDVVVPDGHCRRHYRHLPPGLCLGDGGISVRVALYGAEGWRL